jgi:mono/diheme cytochrome c family protein
MPKQHTRTYNSVRTIPKLYQKYLVIFVCTLLGGCYATTNLNNEELNSIPDDDTIKAGLNLYNIHCQKCHGSDLSGNGPKAVTLQKKPANLKDKSLHFTPTAIKGVFDYPHYSSETISDKIKYGNSVMPALDKVLSRKEIEELTYFITTEIRKDN